MSCEKYEELISLSVSGEITPEEKSGLRRHLAECESCRLVMAREQRLWALIEKSRRGAELPEGLPDRLTARVRTGAPAARRRPRRWKLWAAAAAAAVLLLALLSAGARKPVRVAEVTGGKLLAAEGDGWRGTEEVLSGRFHAVPGEPGSEARLLLADGSRLRVERGATFRLHRGLAREVRGERTVELRAGALTAGVAKDRRERFVVEAPGGKVTATGTRFWVRAGPPEREEEDVMGKREVVRGAMAAALAVAVFEGSVLVEKRGAAAEPVPIEAGQEAQAAPEGQPKVAPRTVAAAIPADAYLFVSAAGRERWKKAFKESTLGAAYREEQVNRFFKPLVEKAEARIKELKGLAEKGVANTLKFDEIERALQGEVGVALLDLKAKEDAPQGDPTREEPVFLLVAEVGEHAEAFETGMGEFIKRVQLMLEGEGGQAQLTARTYRGTDLRVFGVEKVKIAYARTKGYFLLGLDPKSVEKAIDCLEGKAESLAASARIRKAAGGLLTVSFNAERLIRHERAKNPGKKDWREMDAFGLTSASRLNYHLAFEAPAFQEELRVEVRKPAGLMKLLAHARPVEAMKLAADVPPDPLAFVACRLPAREVIPAVIEAAKLAGPKGPEKIRKGLDEMKAHGLDLEALLADSLTGELAAYALPAPGSPIPEVVVIARLNSSDNVVGNLKALAGGIIHEQAVKAATTTTPEGKRYIDATKVREITARLMPREADYRGGKLLFIPVGEGHGKNQLIPAAVILPDRLILASSAAAAKRAAARLSSASSLAKNPAFAGALAKLPAGPVGVQYVETAKVFGMLYAVASPFVVNNPGLQKRFGLNPRDLPPAEAIGKHLVPEVAALYADSKGLVARARVNLPRGLAVGALGVWMERGKQKRRHGAGGEPAPAGDPEPDVEMF